MNACDSIKVGKLGPVAWVRIDGVANHENIGGVRQFLRRCFDTGCRRFVVDMEECRGIDSTFIGILYKLATDIIGDEVGDAAGAAEDGAGEPGVDVINPSQRNADSIRKLGLDWAIKIDPDGEKWRDESAMVKENIACPVAPCEMSRKERAEMVLNAHEALLRANQANESRFRNVVDYLRKDLEGAGGE